MTLIKYIPLIIVGLMILSYVPSVNEALNSMSNRFTNASQSQFDDLTTAEGTLKDLYNRNIVYNLRALIQPKTLDGEDVPFWGFGQGMSTQVGGRLLSINRNAGFSLAEWDGLRIMCESGMIFGWIIIFVRIGYAFRFPNFQPSFVILNRSGVNVNQLILHGSCICIRTHFFTPFSMST